ncbi:MAG: asparagine synthase (glutamine-hydrolyzing) [Phycisphaerae bacterium]|nr:asparagine synthase (glutamine-hydrolyzing) [Phycisphaerae bacterium]
MCGIAGLVLDELDLRGAAWLTAMTQQLRHRGPDDGGAVVFGLNGTPVVNLVLGGVDEDVAWGRVAAAVGLGSRRLAVIDVSPAGHQPMSSPDGNVWIVFNGEIYNDGVLRSELRDRGMAFSGRSDTEVFLAAYRAWGCRCFARLEGMWAAAIVDWGARQVVLSRDRLGIKPLYLTRFDRGVAFASEIKALLQLPGALRGVNEARLRDFLSEGLVDHTDDTLFEGIWSMPAGCWATMDLRTRGDSDTVGAVRRYWRPDGRWEGEHVEPASSQAGLQAAAEHVRSALGGAVRSHLRSDVPVGSCLSGGLDSSAVVSLVHSTVAEGVEVGENWSQHTFTASLPGSPLDETRHAEAVVNACKGLRWHTVEPTAGGLLEDMAALVWHQEQPFGSPSIFMQWEVMRLARDTGVTVLLDGQGGDELFCGYEGYLPAYLAHLLRHGGLGAFGREFRGAVRDHFRAAPLVGHVGAHMLPRGARAHLRRRVKTWRQRWLARELFAVTEAPRMFESMRVTQPGEIGVLRRDTALSRHLWSILLRESLPSLLRYEDRNSMAFSIEARVPLLDRAFVELAMRLPVSQKIRDGQLKLVLREAVRGVVPEPVLARRDKVGFAAPTAEWMHGDLRHWWRDLLTSQSFRDRGCFETAGVKRLTERFIRGDASAAVPIWRMAIVEQWARQFLDR